MALALAGLKGYFGMNTVDLHVHSNRSDGTLTPTELVDYAIEKGLKAFALTDHDTVDGLEEAISHAASLPASGAPEVVPGIELSTEYQGKDIHMVGLYIDYKDEAFQAYLQHFIDSRTLRNQKMCLLLQNAGAPITFEELTDAYPDAVITRAHYASLLLKKGFVKSVSEAFDRYIGDRAPCFIPREKVTPFQAIELIRKANGIPILAHPVLYHMSNARLDALTAELKAAGLMGIEAIYSTYHAGEERQIRNLASKYNLLISGGSDFHGANKPGLDLGCGYGHLHISYSVLEEIKEKRSLAPLKQKGANDDNELTGGQE